MHEYKEIDYQLKIQKKKKKKKKKRNMVFTILKMKIQYKPLHRNFPKQIMKITT